MISELLASITGERMMVSPSSTTRIKRKAPDNLRPASAAKVSRPTPPSDGNSRPKTQLAVPPPRPVSKSHVPAGGSQGTTSREAANKNSARANNKPTTRSILTTGRPQSISSLHAKHGVTSLPSGSLTQPKKPAKKGSFAEIMARAAAAQQAMMAGGMIQHKSLDKLPSKKQRMETKSEQAKDEKQAGKTAKNFNSSINKGTSSGAAASKLGQRNSASDDTGVKKVKKAALATTGYTGTARPRPSGLSKPSTSVSRPPASASAAARLRQRPEILSTRCSRYADEEDEMDDFIEYDEDDDEPEPRRYRHSVEDDESDMEAGLSDIDEEERQAERLARAEDRREQDLEARLKREKETRKRQYRAA